MKTKSEFTDHFKRTLHSHLSHPELNGELLASCLGMSRMHLHRHLIRYFGEPAGKIIRRERLRLARQYLGRSDVKVSQVATSVGFTDPAYFARVFREEYGFSPSELRKREEE